MITNKIWDFINKFNPRFSQLQTKLTVLEVEFKLCKEKYKNILNLFTQVEKKIEEIESSKETELDKYCKEHFKQIPPIAYQQKRDIEGVTYSISLHELITPDSFMVRKLFKGLDLSGSTFDIAKKIGNKVAKTLTWDDDKNLDESGDYYLYPNESIARVKCDCEDHTFVVSSGHKELGGAWGFYGAGGHAFNVFVQDGDLFVLDTVSDNVFIARYKTQTNYKINYIITENHAYEVDGSVIFGSIAGW